MNGKIIFGIGAVILLVVLSVSSSLTVAKSVFIPGGINYKLEQFIDSNQEDLNILNQYLESLGEVPYEHEIPEDIIDIIETLSGEIVIILGNYINQYFIQWIGMNSLWMSDTQEQFFPGDPWHYQGWCLSFNKFVSYTLMTLVLFAGGNAAAVVAFMIGVIPFVGLVLGVIIGAMLALYWQDFYNIVVWLYQNNKFGFIFWLFDPNESPRLIHNKLLLEPDYFLQPDHVWIPEEWFPQASWTRIA